jgi:hypothetical protein
MAGVSRYLRHPRKRVDILGISEARDKANDVTWGVLCDTGGTKLAMEDFFV